VLRSSADDFRDARDLIANQRFADALPLLAKVVSFDPSNHQAYVLWVDCHTDMERFARAVELADEGLTRGIAPAELSIAKSEALTKLGRYEEAAAAAQAALAIDPSSNEAVFALAEIELARGDAPAAIRIHQDLLRRDPQNEDVHYALLELLLESQQPLVDTARDYLRKFGQDADVLAMLGHAYVASREYRRADRAFRDAAELEPDSVEHHVNVLMLARITQNDAAHDRYLEQLADFDEELADEVEDELELLLAAPEDAEP